MQRVWRIDTPVLVRLSDIVRVIWIRNVVARRKRNVIFHRGKFVIGRRSFTIERRKRDDWDVLLADIYAHDQPA